METQPSTAIWKRRWTFLWSLFAPYQKMFVVMFLLFCLNSTAQQASAQFLRQVINSLGSQRDFVFFLLLLGANLLCSEMNRLFFWFGSSIQHRIGFRSSEQLLET